MTKRRGGVMILTLVVLAGVTALLAAAFAREYSETQDTISRLERARARIAAESGIARGLAAFVTQDPNLVTQQDEWYTVGNQANDRIVLGDTAFRMQIVDASSLVNVNTATEFDLQNLGLSTEQIDSLLDWREEGTTPRTDGAKDEFYNSLAYPYNAGLRRLDSLEDVLLIKGFTPATLLQAPTESNVTGVTPQPLYAWATTDSFSPNTDAQGQQKQNINNVQANQLQQAGIPGPVAAAIVARRNTQGPFASMGDVLRVAGMTVQSATALVDGFMVGGQPRNEGRINVNTASENVLTTVAGMTSDVAQAIVSRQDPGVTTLGELFQVPGYSLEVAQGTIDRFTTKSEVFLIRVEGQAGGSRVPLEAVVSINGGRTRVLKVYDPPQSNMIELWGWPDETTNDVELGAGQ